MSTTNTLSDLTSAMENMLIEENNKEQQHQHQHHQKEKEEEEEEEETQQNNKYILGNLIKNIQNKIVLNNIEKSLFEIKQCYLNPQTLTIYGFNQIEHIPDPYWKSRLYTLFNYAYLPHYYIIDCWKDPSEDNSYQIPPIVHIQIITYPAKMFVKESLLCYFSNINYSNISVID